MKLLYLILLFLLLGFIVNGQTWIKGQVTDLKGEPIPGANIYIKDAYDGATSDLNGDFYFKTTKSEEVVTLAASFIGYKDLEKQVQLTSDTVNVSFELKETIHELKAVVISAGAFEASDEKKAVVLKALDIATTAGATADIAGALNTLPGTQRVGEDGQLYVRGGTATETRTFIDGLLVQEPYSSTVPDVPARNRFSPFLFKGTLFSTGGYSAEYGQALSSALVLNTQDLAPQTVTGISLMSVGLGLAHTELWEDASLSVSGNYTNLEPYIGFVPQNIDWEKPFEGVGGQVIYRKKTSKSGIFKFMASGSENSMKMQYRDVEDLRRKNSLTLNNSNYYLNTSFREVLNKKWSFFAGAAYTYNLDKLDERFSLDTEDQSIQGRFKWIFIPSDRFSLRFGGEYLYSNFDEHYTANTQEQFHTGLHENYGAAFSEADIYLSNNFVARVGGRLEYSNLLDQWNLAPRLSLAYKVAEESQFSLAYGHFYQTPENDLLRYHQDLSFERADHMVLNFQHTKENRIFRIESYYKKYKNLVKFDPEQPWLNNNNGNGYARGIDVFFRDRRSIRNGDYWISYSFLDTERDFRDFPESATPSFASAHNASLVYKHWIPRWNTQIGITYSIASGRPFNDPTVSGFNTGRTKAYQDLSMNVSYLTNLFGQFTILHASVSNLPGFDNTFGYRFSPAPNQQGEYTKMAIKQPAPRFIFVGLFVSIGQRYQRGKNPEN